MFKPEDFNRLWLTPSECADVAEEANRLLKERGVRVWGTNSISWITNDENAPTHQALLVCIEELPKKECEHEPDKFIANSHNMVVGGICKHCGVKLKAKWEVAE